ncbi:MAG: metal ABC transporter permease [Waddliaceae bacterium]
MRFPYSGSTFFEFFVIFFQRLSLILQGKQSFSDLASDEIQLLVLLGVSTSCALIGTFLVLRKMTMLANSLSHTILLGIVITVLIFPEQPFYDTQTVLPRLLFGALFCAILTTVATEFLIKTIKLTPDASIAIVFTTFFALGILLATIYLRDIHLGVEAVMGSVDALRLEDGKMVWIIALMNIFLILLFYKEYQVTSFDPGLSTVLGISPSLFHYLLMFQTATTVIVSFRAVGVLMVLAFLTVPALCARLLTHHLKQMLLIAMLIGALSAFFGVALARHLFSVYGLALSTSGLVVTLLALFLFMTIFYIKLRDWRHIQAVIKVNH